MAEEKDLNSQTEEKQESVPSAEPVSEPTTEDKAREMGWKPKEEYQGDDHKWVEAKEFVERKPIYERIHKLEQTNKRLSQTVHEFTDHVQKAEKAAYQKAMSDLESQKAYAVESADTQKVREIDRQIQDLRSNPPSDKEALHPAIETFVETNQDWWSNEEMQDYAISRHNRILAQGGVDMETSLDKVMADVKNRFPDEFHNGNRDRAASVEGGRRGGRGKNKKFTSSDLSPAQRSVGERWVRSGALKNLQEYVNELVKVGDVG